ncbi:TonB-dependent receptor [Campylobacter majalis]|uniref:TonB-dependent receptor n=1 Tax=Campylobacter majalis TaxID=2790656 RepID=UPI003D6900A3
MKNAKVVFALSIATSVYLFGASDVKLNEIMVSANKMEENIKNVAQSISVLDEDIIEQRRIKSVNDIIKEVPNLNSSVFVSKTRVNFRGINQSEFTNSNPVTVYIDGIPQSSTYGNYNAFLTDVERVEILRGPQGALYGKDSIGGVINIITKEPQNEWSGNLGAEYGSYNYLNLSSNANGAIIDDKLFLNLGGVLSSDDGWIKNDYNGDKKANKNRSYKFNTMLTAKPLDRLTLRLTLSADKQKDYFYKGGTAFLGKITRDQAKHANFDMPSSTDSKSFAQTLGLEYEFDKIKLTSLTTHKSSTANGMYDADYGAGNLNDGLTQWQNVKIDTITQELRLNSLGDDRFKWVAGVYFEKEKTENKAMGQEFYMDPPGMSSNAQDAPAKFDATTMAVFALANYEIIDGLTLSAGGRYQQIKKDMDLKMRYQTPNPAWGMVDYDYKDEAKWRKFLPKLGVVYALNDDLSVFANYSMGYLAGGHNYFSTQDHPKNKFEPQTSNNYELGIRGNAFNNALRFSLSAFYMDIKDIHTYSIVPPNLYLTDNGGKATSKGVELEALYRLNNEIDISGSFAILDTKYKEYIGNEIAKGKKIQYSPKYSATFGISYTHPSGFYARLDANAKGETYFDAMNSQKQKAWLSADTRIGYRFKDFDIYGYVTNITNEEYVQTYMEHSGRYGMVHFNDPRKFGLGVRYSF